MGRRFKRVVDAVAKSTPYDHNIGHRIRIQQLPHRINNQHIAFRLSLIHISEPTRPY